MKVEENVQRWLLGSDQPVVSYLTLTTLLDRSENDPDVKEARSNILRNGWALHILGAQKPEGNWESREDLYRPKYTASNWRMIVLSDFGLSYKDDPRLERACSLFFRDWLGNQEKFEEGAEVCESGNLARFLTRLGYAEDPKVERVFRWLVNDQKEDGGWHCFESDVGTLDGWEALAAFSSLPKQKRNRSINSSIEKGAEFYLERELHKEGAEYEPWLRFHYPNHYYYDILVGLDMLTSLGYAGDKRLGFSLDLLKKKRLQNGTWKLDAIHPDLAEGANYSLRGDNIRKFALEQEGNPSKWITLKALQVTKRVEQS